MDPGAGTDDRSLVGVLVDGRYRVTAEIGRGGMGEVYLASHEELRREVAIKVLAAELLASETAVERFLREARVTSQLGHPNIVEIHDLGRLPDGRPYLAMEHLRGETLGDVIDRGLVPAARIAPWIEQAASALDAVHDRGVVHRDIKPDNLFLAERAHGERVLKLLDFGLVGLSTPDPKLRRLTKTGLIYGTPVYMAPEAATERTPDRRFDVYSLSVVIFELLTGRAPFESDNPLFILTEKLGREPPSLTEASGAGFPPSIEQVVLRGLARDPDDRFATAGELAAAFRRAADAADAVGAVVPPPRAGGPVRPSPRLTPYVSGNMPTRGGASRYPIGATALAVLAVLAVGGGAYAAATALRDGAATGPAEVASRPDAPPAATGEAAAPRHASSREPTSPRAEIEPPADTPAPPTPPARAPESPSPRDRPATARDPRPARAASPEAATRAPMPAPPSPPPTAAAPPEAAPPPPGPSASAPTSSSDQVREGTRLMAQGRLSDAAELLREVTRRSPGHGSAWRVLGLAEERLGRTAEARAAYRRYLQLRPDAADADAVRGRLDALGG